MNRLFGVVIENAKILGYMALDMKNMKVVQLSAQDAYILALRGQVVNAKAVRGELVGTEASINRLTIFNAQLKVTEKARFTVLQIMTKEGKPEKVTLMDSYGKIDTVTYAQALDILNKVDAINAKVVKRGDNWVISGILRELPRKEIVTSGNEVKKKITKLPARYINKNTSRHNTIFAYSNYMNDPGYMTIVGDKKVINRAVVVGVSNHTKNSMLNVIECINYNRVGKRMMAHYPNTLAYIKENGLHGKELYNKCHDLYLGHRENELGMCMIKDYALYCLINIIEVVEDKSEKALIKELIPILSKTKDVDEISLGAIVSDIMQLENSNNRIVNMVAYLTYYNTRANKNNDTDVFKKWHDHLLSKTKSWHTHKIGSKNVELYVNSIMEKMITEIQANGALIQVTSDGSLVYTRKGKTVVLDKPMNIEGESSKVIGLAEYEYNVYGVVRQDSNGKINTKYSKFIIIKGDSIIYGIYNLTNNYIINHRMLAVVRQSAEKFRAIVVKSFDGVLYNRYSSKDRLYTGILPRYTVANSAEAQIIAKLMNQSDVNKMSNMIQLLVSNKTIN